MLNCLGVGGDREGLCAGAGTRLQAGDQGRRKAGVWRRKLGLRTHGAAVRCVCVCVLGRGVVGGVVVGWRERISIHTRVCSMTFISFPLAVLPLSASFSLFLLRSRHTPSSSVEQYETHSRINTLPILSPSPPPPPYTHTHKHTLSRSPRYSTRSTHIHTWPTRMPRRLRMRTYTLIFTHYTYISHTHKTT